MTPIELPCPEPKPVAVEVGYFGRCADGSLKPNPAEVQSIIHEHFLQLLALRLEMIRLERTMKTGTSPTSGKIPKSQERQAANRQAAGQLRKEPQVIYLGGLAAYETAFGREAMDQLRRHIDQQVNEMIQNIDRAECQLDLF